MGTPYTQGQRTRVGNTVRIGTQGRSGLGGRWRGRLWGGLPTLQSTPSPGTVTVGGWGPIHHMGYFPKAFFLYSSSPFYPKKREVSKKPCSFLLLTFLIIPFHSIPFYTQGIGIKVEEEQGFMIQRHLSQHRGVYRKEESKRKKGREVSSMPKVKSAIPVVSTLNQLSEDFAHISLVLDKYGPHAVSSAMVEGLDEKMVFVLRQFFTFPDVHKEWARQMYPLFRRRASSSPLACSSSPLLQQVEGLLEDMLSFLDQPEDEMVRTYSDDQQKEPLYCGLALSWEEERQILLQKIHAFLLVLPDQDKKEEGPEKESKGN